MVNLIGFIMVLISFFIVVLLVFAALFFVNHYKEIKWLRSEIAHVYKKQRELLPKSIPNLLGYDIYAQTIPSRYIGANGDLFDFLPVLLGYQSLGLVLIDGTGKGTEGAMDAVMIHSKIKAGLSFMKGRYLSPEKLLLWLNQQLLEMGSSVSGTMIFGILDFITHKFTFARAGNEPVYKFGSVGNHVEFPMNLGQPIGLIADIKLDLGEILIASGEVIILISDGVIEAHNKRKEPFGRARFCKIVDDNVVYPAEQIGMAIIDAVEAHVDNFLLPDDLTVMVIKRLY